MSQPPSPDPTPVITILTDFGTSDYYVAAVKGVLLERSPGATLVDVSHHVGTGDVEGAAWLLAAAARWYPAGTVHLAVVDPGVGSERRILAARAGDSLFVAPDNGLLSNVLADHEDAPVHAVDRPDLYLAGPGSTFHGRDRFAPVAAYLARGGNLDELGPRVEDPVLLPTEPPRAEGSPPRSGVPGSVLRGRVAHVDRFGNLVTDIPSDWLGEGEVTVEVAGDEGGTTSLRVDHFAEIPAGRAAALAGSLGTLELSMDGASLADAWDVWRGDAVTVRFGAGDAADTAAPPQPDHRESAPAAPSSGGEPERPRSAPSESTQGDTGMTQWEYKIINLRSENYRLDPDFVDELNDLGEDGWELVGLTSVNFKSGATDNLALVFKRPL